MDDKLITHITGNVGQDPKDFETSKGDNTKFSVAVTMRYGEDPITRWVNVTVWDEDLRRQVHAEIEKGSKVAIEGKLRTDREYKGEKQYDLSATRVGIVKWFVREKKEWKPAAKQESSSDESGMGW